MEKLEDKPNNDLVIIAKELYHSYEALKSKVLKEMEDLESMEREFKKINRILRERNT